MAEIKYSDASKTDGLKQLGIITVAEKLLTHPESTHKTKQVELFGLEGLSVATRALQHDNPLDIAMFNALQTQRVATGIENIDPEHPDSYQTLKELSGGMRVNPESDALRYVVVDTSTDPIKPNQALLDKIRIGGIDGKILNLALNPKPSEGLSIGNVVFFRDEPDRVKHLGFDPDELRDPNVLSGIDTESGKDNPPKKLYLEISYYNIDALYEQIPHLEEIASPDGEQKLTAFQQGIYLAICDVLRKAKVMGYDPKDVIISGYANTDNVKSERVMKRLGFRQVNNIPKYADDYPVERTAFILGGDDWTEFQKVYSDIIAPAVAKIQPNKQYDYENLPDTSLGIPLKKMTTHMGISDDGIEIDSNLPVPESLGIDIYPLDTSDHPFIPKPYERSETNERWNQERVRHAEENYGLYHEKAAQFIDGLYQNVFTVRQGDKLAIVADSSTALDVIKAVVLRGAVNPNISGIDIVYMRTQSEDDISVAASWLEQQCKDKKIKIKAFDMMASKKSYAQGITEFYNGQYSFSISFQMDDYQIRFNKLAEISQRFGPQALIPGVSLQELTFDIFSADREKMLQHAKEFKDLMKDAEEVRIYGESGENSTDLTYYPSKDWVSEADNTYSTRSDLQKYSKDKEHSADNQPDGEVWTYLPKTAEKKTKGQMAVQLLDTAISAELLKMGLISEEDVAKFNYNPDDPILLHVQDGYVTAISGGHRADLVNQYFKKIQSDNDEKSSNTINWPSLWVGEPGAGINDSVSGVETGTLSTLRTEKELYVLHFGIGNNYDPDEPKDTQAKSHIDLSLRGQKITMDVKLKDGTIRRIISDEAGRLIYANYQTIAPTTSAS